MLKNHTLEINSGNTEGKQERCDYSKFVKGIFHLYSSNFHEDTIRRNVIVQSDPDRFWKILLKQISDLFTDKIALTFAGEAEADAGWLFREFLTLSMKYFAK